jgi:hypothetical protein
MNEHSSSADIAAYLDGVLAPQDRARVEQHVAECDDCRSELIAVSRVLSTIPRRRRWYVPAGIAAAAAAVALLVWPGLPADRQPSFREPAVTTTPAPIGIVPRGRTAGTPQLVWTRVPHAEHYRLTVFDSSGTVLWESPSTDTSIALPRTIGLRPGIHYFWQVEAETGFNRSVKSDVIEFVLVK